MYGLKPVLFKAGSKRENHRYSSLTSLGPCRHPVWAGEELAYVRNQSVKTSGGGREDAVLPVLRRGCGYTISEK